MAKQFGADVAINNGTCRTRWRSIRELTEGLGVDVAIEAVGVPSTFELCTELVRPGGHVANIGVHGKPATLHLESLWTRDVTITTGLVDTYSTPTLLKLLTSRHINASRFVTHHFALDDMIEAFDLMDPAVTGLNAQLSAEPGPQTGLSPVHKRAVGVAHELRRQAIPASIGPVETSGGQEDAQSFSLEAAQACRIALDGVTEVLACELLAVHQARRLAAGRPGPVLPAAGLRAELDALTQGLPDSVADRPFGRDVELLRKRLGPQQRD